MAVCRRESGLFYASTPPGSPATDAAGITCFSCRHRSLGDKKGAWRKEDFWPIIAIEEVQMGQKSGLVKEPAEQIVNEICRATRRQFSAEEKIRIVLSGLRGEDSIAELCRREGIVQNLEGIAGGRQEASGQRHCARRNLGGGQGAAPGGQRVEGGSGRALAGSTAIGLARRPSSRFPQSLAACLIFGVQLSLHLKMCLRYQHFSANTIGGRLVSPR
jgi:hypothetical protein